MEKRKGNNEELCVTAWLQNKEKREMRKKIGKVLRSSIILIIIFNKARKYFQIENSNE